MMKGLMSRCLNHETALDRLRAKATLTKDKLNELKSWKVVQEKKFALSEEARGELENRRSCCRKSWQTRRRKL